MQFVKKESSPKANYPCKSPNTYRCKPESSKDANALAPCGSLQIIMGSATLRPTRISSLRLGCNCDNSHKHELLNFYCIDDDFSGTHLRKSRPLFLLFSRISCPHRWNNGINPDSYHKVDFWFAGAYSCRICVLEFFIVFKLKNQKKVSAIPICCKWIYPQC